MKSMKLGMIWVLGGWDWQCSSQWGLDSAQSVAPKNSTDPVFVGAGDIAGCGQPAQVTKLLPNSSTTSSTLHPLQQRSSPPETTRTTKAPYLRQYLLRPSTYYRPQLGEFKAITSPAQATTSTRRLAPQATSTTSARRPQHRCRTHPTTLD